MHAYLRSYLFIYIYSQYLPCITKNSEQFRIFEASKINYVKRFYAYNEVNKVIFF